MDITDLILRQHDEQRRGFAMLDDLRSDSHQLAAVWSRLAILLEVHAEAEEQFFYPELLKLGTGMGDADGPDDEVKDAIKDHNQIRDAVRDVATHRPGSNPWWAAVQKAREANSDHMAEEEREDLADFRRHASLQLRHDIAAAFVTFESQNAMGITAKDKDPQEYVDNAG